MSAGVCVIAAFLDNNDESLIKHDFAVFGNLIVLRKGGGNYFMAVSALLGRFARGIIETFLT